MRSKQMWVRCGLLAVMVMSTGVSAAPSPGQLGPGLASAITSLEATQVSDQVARPQLVWVGRDWYGALYLGLWCPTPGATMYYYVVDGKYWWPVPTNGVLRVTGKGTLYVAAVKDYVTSDLLIITIS